ncbi:FkbM family methyltransferase [Pleurocapsa sp. FMAR1]|uniref:FkbM family methyltransferase n=1 Tax=Pleurocapsa sp. FMAR1 TaxID=3040204 RepID=UPI0029C7CCC3|nr:FkbM family methyltransferase [Pleurocapsa sp. FMAR1]
MDFKTKLKAMTMKFTRKSLGKYAFAVLARTDSGIFAVDPEDLAVGRSLLRHGNWCNEEYAQISQYVSNHSSVLFVGAHIGSLVVPIAKNCGKVVAIEANPNTFELLKINITLNQLNNCELLNVAANDKVESLPFLLNKLNSGGSKREPKVKKEMYYYDNPDYVKVEAVPLDDRLNASCYDLIVMDIEGSEYFALKGMQRILSCSKILQIEFVPHHLKYVSGVGVDDYLGLISPYFDRLYIPSKKITIGKSEFEATLTTMFNKNEEDDGIIFQKTR